jgi:HK97 family phage portal protein
LPSPAPFDLSSEVAVNNRLARLAEKRAMYVRSGPFDLLNNDPDGWVRNQSGPIRWGDYPNATSGGSAGWYPGSDAGGAAWAVGPNGPNLSGSTLLPAVTRCTTIIASTITRTLWRYTGPNGESLPRPLWIDDPMGLGRMPGPVGAVLPAGLRLDGHSFWETFLTHALWWGRGAFVFTENAEGQPTPGSLRLLNPFLVDTDDDGYWVIDPGGDTPIRTNFDGRFIAGGQVWRLVVLRGMGPNDDRSAEGVLVRHFDTFRLGASVSKYVAQTFAGMGVPSGLLKVSTPGFKREDAQALKADWMAAHGAGKRSVAVLNATVEYSPVSMTPVDTDSANLLHANRSDVAHAFGLSSIWLDEGASGLTYQNNSDRRRDLVDISLAGWSESLMATITALLPFGSRVDVNWTTFTQPSIEALSPALVPLVASGVISAPEARQYLGLVPWTGPDPAYQPPVAIEGAPA